MTRQRRILSQRRPSELPVDARFRSTGSYRPPSDLPRNALGRTARLIFCYARVRVLVRKFGPDSCSAGTRGSLVGFKAPLRMLRHRRRPLQGVAPCPLPSPTLADHARKPHLVAAKNVADFMQGSRIGEWRSDRANPYLPDLVACARMSVIVDLDPVHLADPHDVRTHLRDGGRQRSDFGWSSRHIGFRDARRSVSPAPMAKETKKSRRDRQHRSLSARLWKPPDPHQSLAQSRANDVAI